jgi:hypothetical protein
VHAANTHNQTEIVLQRRAKASHVVEEHGKLCQVERVRQTGAHCETLPRKQRRHESWGKKKTKSNRHAFSARIVHVKTFHGQSCRVLDGVRPDRD